VHERHIGNIRSHILGGIDTRCLLLETPWSPSTARDLPPHPSVAFFRLLGSSSGTTASRPPTLLTSFCCSQPTSFHRHPPTSFNRCYVYDSVRPTHGIVQVSRGAVALTRSSPGLIQPEGLRSIACWG
jgi:hypothetical protein